MFFSANSIKNWIASLPSINLVGVGFVNHLHVVVGVPLVHVSGGQSSASTAPPPSTPSLSLDPVTAARRSLGAGPRFIDAALVNGRVALSKCLSVPHKVSGMVKSYTQRLRDHVFEKAYAQK